MDVVRWLLTIEVISIGFLPVTMWVFGSLPDGGYIFSRVLGWLVISYVSWIAGSFLALGGKTAVPLAALAVACVLWAPLGSRTLSGIRDARKVIAIEQGLFTCSFLFFLLLRVDLFGSAIAHTEQFMDMAFLNASFHSASYPPYDPWMSGHTINYYYLGYLIMATLCRLAGVAPSVGYTLANVTLFSLTAACTYALGYAMTRHVWSSFLAPILVTGIGNWHAALWQSAHGLACGGSDAFWGAFWESTRVIGSGFTIGNWTTGPPWSHTAPCTNPNATITEYPLFSFILDDLHPHVIALPFVLLTLALGAAILFSPDGLVLRLERTSIARLLLISVAVGSLFPINSWDFPTYLAVIAGCVTARAYRSAVHPDWWKGPIGAVVALALGSVLLYIPFYLHFAAPTHGVGRVTTPSDLFEFLQVMGLFTVIDALFVASLGYRLQPIRYEATDERSVAARESGQGATDSALWIGLAVLIGGAAVATRSAVLATLGIVVIAAMVVLYRVLNSERPKQADTLALILIVVGCLAVAIPEVVYLRDSFDGSALYRMNTVFKFYYQGWILLGLGGAYGVYRTWTGLEGIVAWGVRWGAAGAVCIGILAAGAYTAWASSATVQASPRTLDGEAWIAQSESGDLQGIQWLQAHAPEGSVELEAVGPQGGDYQYFARISTFSGLPTVMGWSGHEEQWGRDSADVARRVRDVKTIYTTANVDLTMRLLRQYDVRYVVVGSQERSTYGSARQLDKFRRLMHIAYHSPGITIYTD